MTGLSIDSDFLSWPLRLNLKPIRMTRRSGVGKGLGEKSTDDGPLPTEKVTVEIISKTGSKPKAKGPHLDMDIKQEDEAGPSKLNSEFCIIKLAINPFRWCDRYAIGSQICLSSDDCYHLVPSALSGPIFETFFCSGSLKLGSFGYIVWQAALALFGPI